MMYEMLKKTKLLLEVITMDKAEKKRQQRQENKNEFQPESKSMKAQNQNQTYNARKEGLGPNGRR